MMRKAILLFLYLFIILASIVLYLVSFFNRDLIKPFFSYGGYYLILLLVLFWVITLIQCLHRYKPDLKLFVKVYGPGLIISLILSLIIFTSVEPMFRVLSDETNLVAISKSMTYEKRADNVTMGKWFYDNFYPFARVTPKRPLLFPFLAHIVHIFLGFRAENVFILNFLVLFSLFFLIYALIKRHFGDIWATSALVLVASQPIVSQSATSGGFDLLSTLFLVICFACLRWFLKDLSPIRFQLLWVSLLMLTNIRYEGILIFAITICALTLLNYIKIDVLKEKMSVIYFCTPLILLLTFWQRVLITVTKSQFEFKDAPFSTAYFIRHHIMFFKNLFNYDFFLPYATIVNFIGSLSLLYFGHLFLSGRLVKESRQRHLILICGTCLLAIWCMYTSYFQGSMDHPSMGRFYTTFCVLLSVLALMLLNRLMVFRQAPVFVLVFSILMFVLYHPISVEDRFSRMQTLPRKYRFVMNFLKKESKKNRNFLVISNRPGQYTAHDYGAVNFDYANNSRSIIVEFNNNLYRNIFVIQDIEYMTRKPSKDTSLNENYVLEKIVELQKDATQYTRISKVVAKSNE